MGAKKVHEKMRAGGGAKFEKTLSKADFYQIDESSTYFKSRANLFKNRHV